MHSPSAPKLQPRQPRATIASPRPREVDLEDIKAQQRKLMSRRQGYSSTVLTRGLGTARTQKARVLGE